MQLIQLMQRENSTAMNDEFKNELLANCGGPASPAIPR
jgi:hypothetical protein